MVQVEQLVLCVCLCVRIINFELKRSSNWILVTRFISSSSKVRVICSSSRSRDDKFLSSCGCTSRHVATNFLSSVEFMLLKRSVRPRVRTFWFSLAENCFNCVGHGGAAEGAVRRAECSRADVRRQLAERQRRPPADGARSRQYAGRAGTEERRDTTTAAAPVRPRDKGETCNSVPQLHNSRVSIAPTEANIPIVRNMA